MNETTGSPITCPSASPHISPRVVQERHERPVLDGCGARPSGPQQLEVDQRRGRDRVLLELAWW